MSSIDLEHEQEQTSSDSNDKPCTGSLADCTPHDQVVAMLAAVSKNQQASPGTKPPKETLKAVYNAGIYKANLSLDVLFLQSCMAGMYIAVAGHMFLTVRGGMLGAALFPTGLMAVVLSSGELFTGDALIFMTCLLGKKVTWRQMARNWTVSWLGNFAGAAGWAVVMGYLSNALDDSGVADFAIEVAEKKAFQSWLSIFLKAVGANIMVCLAVWQATCAEDVAGKIIALWFPTAGFVLMGLDHCIANQFLIPVGMLLQEGEDNERSISMFRFLVQALLPATLGNLLGGSVFIGAVYWYAFDSMESMNHIGDHIRRAWASK